MFRIPFPQDPNTATGPTPPVEGLASEEIARRVQLFVIISVIGICTLVPFGIVAASQGNLPLGVADLVAAVVLAGNLYDAGRRNRVVDNVLVGAVVAGLLFAYAFISGGTGQSGFVWYYTFPLLSAFLLGPHRGIIASLLLLAPVVVFFLVDESFPALAQYGPDFKIRFVPSYLVVCLFAAFSEHNGSMARAKLRASRDDLEDRVGERTRELEHANDALEDEVIERRRIEADLRTARDYLQTIVDGVPEAVMVINPDHTLALSNRAMGELAGRPLTAGDRLTCFGVSHGRSTPCPGDDHPCPLREVIRTRRPVAVEHVHVNGEGASRTVEVIAAPIFGEDGDVLQVIQSSRDITERMKALEERQEMELKFFQAQKMESLGLMAGGVAHDFNNILMAVMGNTEVAMSRLPAESPVREQLRRIELSVQRAAALASQMLAYAGSGKFASKTLDLNEMVRDLSHLLETVISKKATLRYDLAADLPAVVADPAQLGQVFMNLITNASEALEDRPGTITVRSGRLDAVAPDPICDSHSVGTVPTGPAVWLEVEDTGCGMDETLLQQIFDPFFSTKFTGRGLGLAALIGIVKGHRGRVCVHSEVGRGTTFRVVVPSLAEAAGDDWLAAARREAQPEAPWRGEGVVLLADDEPDVLGITATVLEDAGFQVVTAVNGKQALERYVEHADEVVATVLDMTMPGMNGEEVFREIRRRSPEAKVVMVSGYDEGDASGDLVAEGLAAFVHKPFRSRDLVAALRTALGQAGSPEEDVVG